MPVREEVGACQITIGRTVIPYQVVASHDARRTRIVVDVRGMRVAGLTNKEIARNLQLSPRTVEAHRANLSGKLEVGSLAELIRRYGALVDGAA